MHWKHCKVIFEKAHSHEKPGKKSSTSPIKGIPAKRRGRSLDRLAIARYVKQNGPRRTACKFDKQHPYLNESTVRLFLKKYTAMKNRGKKNSAWPIKGIPAKRRGRPFMLGIVDKKNTRFLDCTSS